VEASSNYNGYEAESRARHFITTFHYKTNSKGRKQCLMFIHQIMKKCKFAHRDHSGLGCMDELFSTRSMVSSNKVEESTEGMNSSTGYRVI